MSTLKIKVYPSETLFDLIDINIDDIHIEDIVYSLSTKPRYNGHTPWPWTVLDHSIKTYQFAIWSRKNTSDKTKLAALLHDASEAYLGDIIAPVKNHFKDIKKLDENLQQHIYKRFGCQRHDKKVVHTYDKLAFNNEQYMFSNHERAPLNYVYTNPKGLFLNYFWGLTDAIKKGRK